jgi:hypothetical protein
MPELGKESPDREILIGVGPEQYACVERTGGKGMSRLGVRMT